MSKNKQLVINMVGLVIALMSQWLISVLIPRVGGFTDAGYFTLATTYGNTLLTIALYNMRTFQVADSFSVFSKKIYILSRIVTTAICTLICIGLLLFLDYSMIEKKIILLYWGYRAYISLLDIFYGFWQTNDKLQYVGIMNIIDGVVSFLSFTISYFITKNMEQSLIIMVVNVIVVLSVLGIGYERKTSYTRNIYESGSVYELLRCCFPLMIASILPVILNSIPKMILREYYAPEIVGIYGSISAPTVFITTFTNGLIAPYIVTFNKMKNEKNYKGQKLLLERLISIIIIICILAIILSYCAGKMILVMLFGTTIEGYVHVLEVLICAMLFNSVYIVYMNFFMIYSKRYSIMVVSLIGLVVGGVFSYLLIPNFSVWGAAITLCFAYFIQCVIMYGLFCNWSIKNR